MTRAVGLDFGTTNSAIAVREPDGVRLATYEHYGATLDVFRTVLFLERPAPGAREAPPAVAGPDAIDRYLSGVDGRLIQSIKSFLSSKSFTRTNVFNRVYTFEQLLTFFLQSLRRRAEADLGPLGERAVVGRPVRYAGDSPRASEELALERMRAALAGAGFTDVEFTYEPVGAAFAYDADLDRDQVVLVADFGGGTSDFCLMRVGPSTRGVAEILGTEGVGVAGDALDARIVRHVVAPALGYGTRYRSTDKWMTVPRWLYGNLEKWHHLSFLKDRDTLQLLLKLTSTAEEPEKLQALTHLVKRDLGFHLHQAVQTTKVALSEDRRAPLRFVHGPIEIEAEVTRDEFEDWIAEDVSAMAEAVDRLHAEVDLPPGAVDRVFMTGGTSFVPAVRRLFDERYGQDRVASGEAFTSVALGLARSAA